MDTKDVSASKENYTEQRPWGSFTNLLDESYTKVKELRVHAGGQLSLQLHHKRDEHWIVVKGTATVTLGDELLEKRENEHIFIPKETKHRIENKTDSQLILIEVQTGTYFGEDDIVRFNDKYGRA